MAADKSLDIRVSEPQTQGEGRAAYTTYKITSTQHGLDKYEHEMHTVIRRFSDFDWLMAQLLRSAPAMVIPPLPEKSEMQKFNAEFIEARTRGLQRFVDRIAIHPTLRELEAVRQFLTASETEFSGVREASKDKVSEMAQKGLTTFVSTASTVLGSAVDRVRGIDTSTASTKTAEDLSFEELETYISGVGAALNRAARAAERMGIKRREAAVALVEFGKAYKSLGQNEKEDLGRSLQAVGETAVRQAQMEAMQCNGEMRWFQEDLSDAVRIIESTKRAFAHRNAMSDSVRRARALVEKRRAELSRLAGVPGEEVKRSEAERALKAAQDGVDEARTESVKTNNEILDEVSRLRAVRLSDAKLALLDFAVMESMRGEATENLWSGIADLADKAAAAEEAKAEEWRRSGADMTAAIAAIAAGAAAEARAQEAAASAAAASSGAGAGADPLEAAAAAAAAAASSSSSADLGEAGDAV